MSSEHRYHRAYYFIYHSGKFSGIFWQGRGAAALAVAAAVGRLIF